MSASAVSVLSAEWVTRIWLSPYRDLQVRWMLKDWRMEGGNQFSLGGPGRGALG